MREGQKIPKFERSSVKKRNNEMNKKCYSLKVLSTSCTSPTGIKFPFLHYGSDQLNTIEPIKKSDVCKF